MARRFFPRARRADSGNGKSDWHAKWIWCEGEPAPKNFYLHARRIFELKGAPQRATLRCTADSRYELYVNGQYVGRGPVRSDPRYQTYDTYDITSLLTRGKNVVAVLVHHYGDNTYSYVLGRGGLICQLEITDEAGETQYIGTDESWKVLPEGPWLSQGAKMSRRLGYQEVYDARLDPGTWTVVKFNDKKWQSPAVLGAPPVSPWENLIPRTIPHLHEEAVLPAGVVTTAAISPSPVNLEMGGVPSLMAKEEFLPLKKGDITGESELVIAGGHGMKIKGSKSGGKSVIIDFGREVSGRIRLDITGYAGGVVDIGYSEKLVEGRMDPGRSEVLYTDRLIMRPGRYTWTTFESRGFRYMQLDFRDITRPVHLHSVSVIETLYPTELLGRFQCSDDMLNRIWATGAETARLCMEDTYMDCPWRERGEWWGDARVQSHAAYYAFGDTALLGQGIRHIARTQRQDGAVMCMYPVHDDKIIPDFAALWVMSVWEYYGITGDRGALFELYPAVTRVLQWLNKFTDHDGLLANVEGWNFVDWAELGTEGEVTAINCLYYKALRRAEHMAIVLGRGADADRWNGMAALVRLAINKHLWSPSRGLYSDCRENGVIQDKFSRQTNILAILFDIPDHYRKNSVCRHLLNGGLPELKTPYFMGYFTDALFRMGYAQEAIDIIRKKWGAMIEAGASTFWEHFTPEESLCHGWSTSPTRDLSAYVLGVQPVAGKKRMRIEPHPGDLRWASGVVPTSFGEVEVEWKVNRRDFMITVRVPRGLTCDLHIPASKATAKVTINGKQQEGSIFELPAGTFRVKVQYAAEGVKAKETILDRNAKESLVEYLSGYQLWRSTERRTRRSRSAVADAEAEEEQVTDDEIEYVPGLDDIPPIVSTATPQEFEEPQETQNKKRPRRRRKGKAPVDFEPAGTVDTDVQEQTEEAAVAESAVEADAAVEQPVEEPKRRSRRGRRGRGRGRTDEAAPVQADEPEVDKLAEALPEAHFRKPEVQEEAAAVIETAQEKSGRRRSRRRRPIPAAETVEQTMTEPEVPAEAPAAAGPEPSQPESERRTGQRRRRGGRQRRQQTIEPAVEPQVASEALPETPQPVEQAPVVSKEQAAEKPRSRRRPRRKRAEELEPAAAVEASAVPETVEQPVEEPKKPQRRSRRRKPAAEPSTSDAQPVVSAEPVQPAPVSVPEPVEMVEAPTLVRRRRPSRRRRSAGDQEDPRLTEE